MGNNHPIGRLLERVFERVTHVRYFPDGGMYRYAVHAHKGSPMALSDGTTVGRGDAVIELHLDNEVVHRMRLQTAGGRRFALAFLHGGREGLTKTARLAEASMPDVRAVFANTPRRFAVIAANLGYEQRELPDTLARRVIGRMQRGVLKRFDPENYARIPADSDQLVPVEIWMARSTLMERYLR